MISTPLRMEKPVRRPIVPPISPSAASVVTLGENLTLIFCVGRGRRVWSHFWVLCVDLDIPFNLIISCCVKEDIHLLQWRVLYQHSWNGIAIVGLLNKKKLTWIGLLWVKPQELEIAFFVALVMFPQRFLSVSFSFGGVKKTTKGYTSYWRHTQCSTKSWG